MNTENLKKITALRHKLHSCPERSGQEEETRALLKAFLIENTNLEITDCGTGFYAAHREPAPSKPAIALRADYDALALPDGSAAHLCGHDGHAAALCGVALELEQRVKNRNIFLLFQPGEETGIGALSCLSLFQQEQIDEIYGAHNLPGYPLGQVLTRPGTFACASRGVTLSFQGAATHAAYPEHGINPASAIGTLLCELPRLAAASRYTGMTLCTIIGVSMGEKAFGAAAASGEIWLTLRAEHNRDLEHLRKDILDFSHQLAREHSLGFHWTEQDVFPATENQAACAERVLALCNGTLLPEPMRWSEDFGHYLMQCPGAFFGIGSGETCPALHTEHYEYPDALLSASVEAFLSLL